MTPIEPDTEGTEVNAWAELVKSLNATNVLSDDYKGHVMAWVNKACEQARERGRKEGRQAERETAARIELAETRRKR